MEDQMNSVTALDPQVYTHEDLHLRKAHLAIHLWRL